jgi:hypothetical protein
MSLLKEGAFVLGIHSSFDSVGEEDSVASRPLHRGMPFREVYFDLSDLASSAAKKVPISGHQLLYRREGSAPGGRLNVQSGGEFKEFYPGSRIRAPFSEFIVSRSESSSPVGPVRLLIIQHPAVDFEEPPTLPSNLIRGAKLMGDVDAGTFTAVPEDTVPSGNAPTGSFLMQGWQKLRIYLDGGASNTMTSVELVPWFQRNVSGTLTWFAQTDQRLSIPDTDTTAARRRVFTLDLSQYAVPSPNTGRMFLEVRNLLPSAATDLGMAVEGVG